MPTANRAVFLAGPFAILEPLVLVVRLTASL